MDDRGHTEGEVNPHSSVSDLSKSSLSPENSWSQGFLLSDSEWENTSDDVCFLEAAEDVELAEAADDSLNYAMEEIPDELLLDFLRKEDLCTKGSILAQAWPAMNDTCVSHASVKGPGGQAPLQSCKTKNGVPG